MQGKEHLINPEGSGHSSNNEGEIDAEAEIMRRIIFAGMTPPPSPSPSIGSKEVQQMVGRDAPRSWIRSCSSSAPAHGLTQPSHEDLPVTQRHRSCTSPADNSQQPHSGNALDMPDLQPRALTCPDVQSELFHDWVQEASLRPRESSRFKRAPWTGRVVFLLYFGIYKIS